MEERFRGARESSQQSLLSYVTEPMLQMYTFVHNMLLVSCWCCASCL